MKTKKVLITGISGFIGGKIAGSLPQKNYELTGIVRPKTNLTKLTASLPNVNIVRIDLTDIDGLKAYLQNNQFDVILHIGALRGGRKFNNRVFYDANVRATEQIATVALETDAVLVFCSSVGVYGAIPNELPANINTEVQEDNYYHFTKIKAEQIIQNLVMRGLKAHTVRPAITYGINDYGFPYTLTKLVAKKLFFMPNKDIRINMANIELLKEVFVKLTKSDFEEPKLYNIADKEPVYLSEVVDYISDKIHGKPYPLSRAIPVQCFRKTEKFARSFGMNNLLNRIQLISYDWYYDTRDTYNDLGLKHYHTIPGLKDVIEWYKSGA